MRISVVVPDSQIYIDKEMYIVDMSKMPKGIKAIQWYDTWGDVEWCDEYGAIIKNEYIESFDEFNWLIDLWQQEKEKLKNL